MTSVFFKKTILTAMIAALMMMALPVPNVFAAGKYDPPPPSNAIIPNERLEKIWAHELKIYARLGRIYDRTDTFVEKLQALIDRAAKNGKDVSAVQAALNAFEAALKDAHPIYESAKGIINSHQGFDENGKVTDAERAKETVKEMGDKLKEIRAAMGGTGKALKEAIQAFREANKPPPTQTAPGS
jgi:hypothetical protein